MPFNKVGKDDYTSPSGRHFNTAQVRLYHANGDKFPGEKKMSYAKGGDIRKANYAKGGAVLGRTRNFLKESDEFRDPDEGNATADADQKYGKTGDGKGSGMVALPPTRTNKKIK
jgi:hypothetical protein